jgi:chromosome segregation ATPase
MVHSRAGESAATIATLNFGQSALSITTRPVPREHAENHAGMRAQIDRMEQERLALEERLNEAERRLEERESEARKRTLLPPPVTDSSESSEYESADAPVQNSNDDVQRMLERLEDMNSRLYNYVQLTERFECENARLRDELEACMAQKARGGPKATGKKH